MKLRILHLEDNATDADLVRSSLARGGLNCDILPVNSGDAYLAALQRPEFDVILSDSGVPGYGGRAALAAAHDHCPSVPFIVVSGSPRRDNTPAGVQPAAAVAKSELEQLAPVIRHTLHNVTPSQEEELETASYVWGMQQLVSVVQRLSLARSLQSIMDIVRHSARNLVGADGASFILRDGENSFYAEEDAIGPLWKGRRFPLSSCVSGWSMLNRQPAVIKDVYQDARIAQEAYRPTFVKSLVMMPIRTLAPIGAIGVYWARPHRATGEEVELLQALADSTSVAIESVELVSNLEQRMTERTSELHRRSAELEVLNRELEAFSYSVAHDLRSPLISIDGFSQVLLESHGEKLDDTGRSHLERITSSARRMHRLINDLLELSKVVRAPMHHTTVDLSRIANDIVRGLRESAPDRSASVVVADNVMVEGDSSLLRIALEHLFSNAWKFTSKTTGARIEFGSRIDRSGRRAYFLRDNGAGFDPRHASNLFSPFRRLHPESQFPGSGIGLATVQRIVHRHSGEIWAEAAVDRGACFYFTLPT
ncbi:MAG TPA: ATP-binding protein [Steroidobacteraceae bacterium]|nr:ATP-binding protein [Steroidobacteraceae bacterium]